MLKVFSLSGERLRYATLGSAGIDIPFFDDSGLAEIAIMPGRHAFLRTGVTVQLDYPNFGMLVGRSSMFAKGIVVHQGTIDSDYEGEIRVLLWNTTDEVFSVRPGDRIAQLLVMRHEVFSNASVCDVVRGTRGFGSTGR